MKQRQVGQIVVLAPRGYLTGGEETDELERTRMPWLPPPRVIPYT